MRFFSPLAAKGIRLTLGNFAWGIRACIVILSLLCVTTLEWTRPALLARLDETLRDSLTRRTASTLAESRVVVVDIDDESMRQLGQWPWPRDRLADLVELLFSTYRAKAVGLDLVMPDAGTEAGDARLRALEVERPLVFAQILDYTRRENINHEGALVGGIPVASSQLHAIPAFGFIGNHPGFKSARCVGNIGYEPDPDGVLRYITLRTLYEQHVYFNFASQLWACANGRQSPVLGSPAPRWRIPFKYSMDSYAVVPAADILAERVPVAQITGRYVLVGSSALGLGDRVSTPLTPLSAGVMVHAASLSSLLDHDQGLLSSAWSGRGWLLVWFLSTAFVAIWCIARTSAWIGVSLILGLSCTWLTIGVAGVLHGAEWSLTAPLVGYAVLLMVGVPYEWWRSQLSTQQLLTTLAHYVAAPVLQEIVRQNHTYSLAPTLRQVTVLIADMENYTQTTSSLSLKEAAGLTTDFLTLLTDPVLALGGTLDKYTGDGLVAFWGAPLECDDQADRAVAAALQILTAVQKFNQTQPTDSTIPAIRVRIGIESGRALVGDLGTAFRSTYTAVGDCINFASRLEEATKGMQVSLAIGPSANAMLKSQKSFPLAPIAIRGTHTTIQAYSVTDAIS